MERAVAISRADFTTHAKPLTINFNGTTVVADPRQFSTGSFGWHIGGKYLLDVGGTKVKCQLGLNLTVIGSKEAV